MAVDYEKEGKIAIMTINRPEARNALSADVSRELNEAMVDFRDNPDLWVAIIKANTKAVVDGLNLLGARLGELGEAIQAERWSDLKDFLGAARVARLELFAKPEYGGPPVALSMMVPDRPGVLAEVTTAATQRGANIEDLRIVHSTEGGRGRLELVVAGEERAERLVEDLLGLGYHVDRRVE